MSTTTIRHLFNQKTDAVSVEKTRGSHIKVRKTHQETYQSVHIDHHLFQLKRYMGNLQHHSLILVQMLVRLNCLVVIPLS